MTLSIKQLEEDPLLETLDKVIPQVCKHTNFDLLPFVCRNNAYFPFRDFDEFDMPQEDVDSSDLLSTSSGSNIEPLPGLETIFEELLKEDGYESLTA